MRLVPTVPTTFVAVTVMVFTPGASGTDADQAAVPVATPLEGTTRASVDQLTLVRPTASDAVPERTAGAVPVVNVSPVVGVVIATWGAEGSYTTEMAA